MNYTEHILICIMEECAEVQEMASKILRFGPDCKHYPEDQPNYRLLAKEITDLLAVIDMLQIHGKNILDYPEQQVNFELKKEKLHKYMGISHDLGLLQFDKEWGHATK